MRAWSAFGNARRHITVRLGNSERVAEMVDTTVSVPIGWRVL